MKIFSNKKKASSADKDRVAELLANMVLKVQARLAERCSKRFNTYSTGKKRFIFLALAALIAGILLSGIFSNYYTIPQIKQTYQPAAHIGMASDINKTYNRTMKLTDSLTTNH